MRTNLITRLKEEWNNLDPVDPLRGLIADAIDALAEAQPSKPLTDEQRMEMWRTTKFRGNGGQVDWFIEGTRAAEAAHGIKGDA